MIDKVITSAEEANLSRTPKAEVEDFILKKELGSSCSYITCTKYARIKWAYNKRGSFCFKKLDWNFISENMNRRKIQRETVINMSCYELYPDYEELFWPSAESSNKESILEVQYMKNDYSSMLPQLTLPATEGGWSALNALWSFVDAFQVDNGKFIDEPNSGYNPDEPFKHRDPRLTKIVLCPGGEEYNGRFYNPLDKFIDGQSDRKNLDYHEEAAASRGGLLVKNIRILCL